MSTEQSTSEYEMRESRELRATLEAVERAPLADRREARREWQRAMMDPALVAQRVSWLIDGCYGKGAYDAAWRILRSPRMNRAAALGQMIAALEWRCPSAFARQAWRELAVWQQKPVTAAIEAEIRSALEQEKEGAQ